MRTIVNFEATDQIRGRVHKLFRGSPRAAEIYLDGNGWTGNEPPYEESVPGYQPPGDPAPPALRPEVGPAPPRRVRLPGQEKPSPVRRCYMHPVNPITGLCKAHDVAPSVGSRVPWEYTADAQCEAFVAYLPDGQGVQIGRVSTPCAPEIEVVS
jgi:hypothetical protein